MGLFDGYVDPDQFRDSGGLLGRLLSLQQGQEQYQPGSGLDPAVPAPQPPALVPLPWPNLVDNGRTPVAQPPGQDLHSQYTALRPLLGDHNAMLATVNPEARKSMIAQALVNQQTGNTASVVQAGYRLGGIPFPPRAPAPPPPIPMPTIPDWWKDVGLFLRLYPGMLLDALGVETPGSQGPVILNNGDEIEDPGDKPASTPIGRRGNRIEVKPGTNRPTTIGGRIYTGHAADKMQGDGVPPSAVEEAIQNGEARPGNGPGETLHIGTNGVKVVTGSDGQVITVYPGKR